MYGKQTETAIAAMSRLAEMYDDDKTRLSAIQIADSRGLQRPFVAKILTMLSQAGLVSGSPGPGGGYILALPPDEINLADIYRLFERENESDDCPFGGGVCGVGDPCPLHDKLVALRESLEQVLQDTTFEAFRVAYQEHGMRPTPKGVKPTKKRESYRTASKSKRR
ncbi:MAG: Rrf2 family transcriptional regulator [Planctomycetota bacterium]|nr:Rrf2 family transcriptional regulator [Planctomycetota bacterium]